ncbi:ATP-grasp domain-containing protein [Actinoplanes sp. NPDC020271]|uniref:ATP-grasp domain-containing protein n=1 Tax=Actinoplanes sp. NPDC020271 TaxID=3363896 RepID=UPI0037A9C4DF
MTTAGVVTIVDFNGSAARLAAAFNARGLTCIRVQSNPEAKAPSAQAEQLVTDRVIHHGDFDATLKAVAAHEPVIVIAGGESGVELADQLSEALGLRTNGTALSYARRTKDAQIATVRAAGLPTARQLSVTSADELADWHRRLGGRVVVKPTRSARNDGVSFCDTPEAAVAAYERIRRSVNVYGLRNEGVVAQEYLSGTEYIVNTVSCGGTHRLTDMWEYSKITVNGIPDRINGMTSVPAGASVFEELRTYAFGVLDALAIGNGPVHLELMLTADGPRIVEAGARMCGEDVAQFAALATGESQVDRTVQAYLEPERFLADAGQPYRLGHHAAMVFMASPVEGTLRSYPLLPLVHELRSYRDSAFKVNPGDILRRTVDDSSEPLWVGLSHPDRATLLQDFMTVIYLDGFGFYDLEPA